MGIDDQKEEREVLESIYPDEITDTSENAYRISITLDLPLGAPAVDDDDDDGVLAILLNVSYPDAYPDVAPNLDIAAPPNALKYPFLDVAADKAQLLDSLRSTIEDSIGMPMVFSLVTTLKDAAEALIADRQRQVVEVREVAARQKEEEENRKFHGEKVTRERFLEWRAKFIKEIEEKEKQRKEEEEAELKNKKVKTEEKKLTGKQLWERGLVGKVDDDADFDALLDAAENLKVEA